LINIGDIRTIKRKIDWKYRLIPMNRKKGSE
jgi:hypothetical protein